MIVEIVIRLQVFNIYIKMLQIALQLRGSSMGACEALSDMLACKKGYTNTFDLI